MSKRSLKFDPQSNYEIRRKPPPNLTVLEEHLCYIKYYDTELKRTNFLAKSYEKDFNDDLMETIFVIKGTIKDKDQKINLFENLSQVIYSIQIADTQTWQIEHEYLNYNAIYSLEIDTENNITLTLYKDPKPNEDFTVSREPKLIKGD